MTKEMRAAAIQALVACPCSGFAEADIKMLESASDERLEAFKAASESRAAELKAAKAAAKGDEPKGGDCPTCAGNGKAFGKDCKDCSGTGDKSKGKAAAAAPMATPEPETEEQYLAKAPASIRSLVERQKKQDAEQKTLLVNALKTAQSEYTEAELNAMPVEQLQRVARIAKADTPTVDFSGAGVVRAAAKADDLSEFAAPDSYGLAAKK
jgi:hypothetical protein